MIIGIDLGTTTTEAAVYRNGKIEMITDSQGKIVTPSVIGLDENNEFIVGERAKAQYLIAPERTVIEVKRKMGTDEKISLGGKKFLAKELSAKLLSHVKTCASEYLDEEISEAVISVPAYFDEIQRQAVMEAGKLAGFDVKRIINEPTAAAMSYGIEHMEDESHILIYDLGGGTFDVTLLEMFDGVLEVKASSGDNQLGGKEFDERIINYLVSRFEEKNNVSLKGDAYAFARLKDAAEKCKIALSTEESYLVQIPLLTQKDNVPIALEENITRTQFEEMIADLIERTHYPIDVVLRDGEVEASEIDLILLVGGSTRIPIITKDITEYLGQAPKTDIDPDYSVAQGAAVQAAIIADEIEAEKGLIVTDVNPYSLGVRTINGFDIDHMSVIIPKNVTIPVTREDVFYTSLDYETEVNIEVYQGESSAASKNHLLGKFKLSGIPSKPQGEEKIIVSFSYDLNGMLNVSARVKSTGKEASVKIDMANGNESDNEVMDVSEWKKSEIASNYRSIIRKAEKYISKTKDDFEREQLEDIVYELKCSIINGDEYEADELVEELNNIL
ncbi:MAG: Hsp70 family protein [Lachnospiraceae bacterium]|nr:Hsp70 family protein [Lachnospiraceae bacterium]